MSILDKKLFLSEFEKRLGDIATANDVRRIIEHAADVLTGYELTAEAPGGSSESDSLIDLFLSAKTIEGRSEKTIDHYRYVLGRLRDALPVPLGKATVHHLRTYLMAEKDRGVSLRTLEGYRYTFSSFFGWAWKEELIPKNPTANLMPIKQQKVIRLPYSAAEIERLKRAATSPRDQALLAFLLASGCRISEVCSLDVLDVDFRAKAVTVLGKGNKQRVVYLDDVAVMHLDRYLSSRCDGNPALFAGKGSDRITPGGVRAMLRRLGAAAGVDNVHPHRFRRTLATNLIAHGMQLPEVAAILGHDKIDTTMTYVHIDQRNVEASYRRLA